MLNEGSIPLLVSFPHAGTEIPASIAARMTAAGRAVPDTDWHLPQLYEFARLMGASTVQPRFSRYVIDLNRPPDDASLYPGLTTTSLCTLHTFAGDPVYRSGQEPGADEIADRRELYWEPYHAMLANELDRIRERHGIALLLDAHSIASRLPRLFDGQLPDVNLGTHDGRSCALNLQAELTHALQRHPEYSHVVDGRFKGGYITRHYGRPADRLHAFQVELTQRTYMDEAPPFAYRMDLAQSVRPVLDALVRSALDWAWNET